MTLRDCRHAMTLLLALAITPALAQQTTTRYDTQHALSKQQPVYIENLGQWDQRARFLLRSPGLDIWITNSGVVYDIHHTRNREATIETTNPATTLSTEPTETIVEHNAVSLQFVGAHHDAIAHGTDRAPGSHNYFIGNDHSRWASNVPLYNGARIRSLYFGIDAVFYLDQGRPRYDLVVAPGADASQIQMRFDGARSLSTDKDGSLVIATELGQIRQQELYAYQTIDGHQQQVACAFQRGSDGVVRFVVGEYDRSVPLVIDPVTLSYSTYLGGSSSDESMDIAVDALGNAYVTGDTYSPDFPTLNQYQTSQNNLDVFVTKLTYSGSGSVSLVYSTYLGGNDLDYSLGIAVDALGNAYITGYTNSTDFPTLNQYQTYQTDIDAFVTKLSYSGNGSVSLVYSTYLGGSNSDYGLGIAVDVLGNAYVTGETTSTDFPTLNQYQTHQTDYDAFVTKLSYSGSGAVSLVYSTYLGGNGSDIGYDIAVDALGNAYVTGDTYSTDFPTLNQYQTDQTDIDAFVTKLSYSGSGPVSLVYSTYLGGDQDDRGQGIAVDALGNAYVTGYTTSTNFPTLNQYQTHQTDQDAFVTKLAYSGSGAVSLVYSTYLGGNISDIGNGIGVDTLGNAYVTGETTSTDFPTLNQYQTDQTNYDAFVTKLAYSGSGSVSLVYSTYLGGNDNDVGRGIAVDALGNTYITGDTYSKDFPTLNQYQTDQTYGDMFVTKLDAFNDSGLLVEDDAEGDEATMRINAVTPNPASNDLLISYSLPETMTVSVAIFTSDGRLVATPINAKSNAVGTHSENIDISELAPGTYTLHLTSGIASCTSRFVVVR